MQIDVNNLIKLLVNEQNNKMMSIENGYQMFLNYIKEFKSIETYDYHLTYYRAVKRFFDLEKINYTNQITSEVILKFINYEKLQGNKNTTINKKIAHIKYMLDYLFKLELISEPKIKVDKLPSDEKRFSNLSKEQLLTVINALNKLNDKDKLMMMLFITTGIRRNEIYNIKLSDLYLNKKYINLSHTKNGKQRNIYLNDEEVELIKKISKDNTLYLFENNSHTNHENPDNIRNLERKIEHLTNIHVTPHMLRHTYATNLLNAGTDLESIRLLLGHSDYSMIKRYVHIKNEKLADISTSLYYDLTQHTEQ